MQQKINEQKKKEGNLVQKAMLTAKWDEGRAAHINYTTKRFKCLIIRKQKR